MSGTSMDGIDVVIAEFNEPTDFRLIAAKTFTLTDDIRRPLQTIINQQQCHLKTLGETDVALGKLIARSINELLAAQGLTAKEVTAIGSHGHTLFHHPDSHLPFSLQIGNANLIAEITNITTITDFRQRDIAVGGQGAPLVPAFHQYLFSHPKEDRIIINIGGISNLTWLPASPHQTVTGFDTGPGNILIDYWSQLHLKKPYDDNGKWAAKGQCDHDLLDLLLADPYFDRPIPKSTGRELFNQTWLETKLSYYKKDMRAVDVQATLTALTAQSIANHVHAYATQSNYAVFVCGGGAHNAHLLNQLQTRLDNKKIIKTDELGLHPDWVEASAFAWLAYRTIRQQTGNLPSATGAKKATILGSVYLSNNAS